MGINYEINVFKKSSAKAELNFKFYSFLGSSFTFASSTSHFSSLKKFFVWQAKTFQWKMIWRKEKDQEASCRRHQKGNKQNQVVYIFGFEFILHIFSKFTSYLLPSSPHL